MSENLIGLLISKTNSGGVIWKSSGMKYCGRYYKYKANFNDMKLILKLEKYRLGPTENGIRFFTGMKVEYLKINKNKLYSDSLIDLYNSIITNENNQIETLTEMWEQDAIKKIKGE